MKQIFQLYGIDAQVRVALSNKEPIRDVWFRLDGNVVLSLTTSFAWTT